MFVVGHNPHVHLVAAGQRTDASDCLLEQFAADLQLCSFLEPRAILAPHADQLPDQLAQGRLNLIPPP